MNLAAVLNPVHAAGVIHAGAPVVLNPEPCGYCEGAGWDWKLVADDGLQPDDPVDEFPCPTCGGSGTVAPSVTPGQHLLIATTRTKPNGRQSAKLVMSGAVEAFHFDPEHFERGYTGITPTGGAEIPLHLGKVIGSVTATTPALPIVDCRREAPNRHEVVRRLVARQEDAVYLYTNLHTGAVGMAAQVNRERTDLSSWLPWLGDDLVGRSAVLIAANDETNLSDCRYYARFNSFPGHDPEATCSFGCRDEPECVTGEPTEGWPLVRLPVPVPLPDGVDLTEGTLTEVDL